MNGLQATIVKLLITGAAASFSFSAARTVPSTNDVPESCARSQCLIQDFIGRRNNNAGTKEAATRAFGRAIELPEAIDDGDMSLCLWVPATDCFSRVLLLRQSIYRTPGHPQEIGCVVLGGISKVNGRFESFGVVYEYIDSQWQPSAVGTYAWIGDALASEALLTDPCPPIERTDRAFVADSESTRLS